MLSSLSSRGSVSLISGCRQAKPEYRVVPATAQESGWRSGRSASSAEILIRLEHADLQVGHDDLTPVARQQRDSEGSPQLGNL